MILRLKLLILTLTILLFGLNVQAVETLISPVSGSSPGEIRYFTDKSGRLNLVYQYDHNEKISEIFYLIHENEKWSSPIKIEFPFSNQKTLYDIKTLSGGSPLLIFGGDTTDYAKVLNIPNPADISTDANNQLDLGLPQSDLIKLLKDNQRLFFSLQSKGSWTSPIPIMDSYGAFDPVAAVGPNNNALLAFRKDLDGNSETKNDIEIFITSFSGTLWSKPFRLTNNAVYEGGIQLKWTNQGYLLIWVADNNSALYSSSYKTINSAIFSSSGELSSSPSLVVSAPQKSPMPILGSIGGEGRLIWASEKASETDSRRPLWESRFSGSWSEKVETGLFSYQPNNGDLFVVGNRTFLVYQDGSSIKVALNNGSGWSSGGSSITFDWSKINFIDSAFQLDQNGVLKVAFSGSLTQSADPDESMSGIYHSTFPLQSDLAISGFKTQSSTHVINGNVGVQFSVYNAGFLGSGVYQIQVKNEDNLLQTFEETTLSPGAFKEFEFSFKLLKPSFPIKILLLPTTEDNNEANNQFSTSINVLPDYIVSKVYKKDSGTIIAKIKETRKVAAPPVKVNFYSLVESDRKLIGSGDFDPNSNMPLVVSWPEMATLQSPFRIIVEVNADRSVKESSYSNNQGTFSFTPKADFSIKYLNVTKSSIYLTVSNLGDKYVDKVDLLLTDNPLIAGQSNISAGQKPLFYDLVGFENSMEKRMVFNRNSIEEIKGDYLYAVINPYGSISESSRNNNQLRTILSLSDMGGGNDSTSDSTDDGGTGGEEPGEDPYNDMTTKLEFSNSSQWCGTLRVEIANSGTENVIAPSVELYNQNGFLTNTQSSPVIRSGEQMSLQFDDVSAGNYLMRLIYSSAIGEDLVEESTVIMESKDQERCQHGGRDINLVDVTIGDSVFHRIFRFFENKLNIKFLKRWLGKFKNWCGIKNSVQLNLEFKVKGFDNSFRKPLVRVPVIIEIKNGPTVLRQIEYELFLPETTGDETFVTDIWMPYKFFKEDANLIVRIPQRDDENIASNNSKTITIE